MKKIRSEYLNKYGSDILQQIIIAAHNDVKYFITSNKNVLDDRVLLEKKYPIKIMTAREWTVELNKTEGRL